MPSIIKKTLLTAILASGLLLQSGCTTLGFLAGIGVAVTVGKKL